MCLPNFVEFIQIGEKDAMVGYRVWKNIIKEDNLTLLSEHRQYKNKDGMVKRYEWNKLEGPHEVKIMNSGIYAHNNYHYYHNNDNNDNYDYYDNNYHNNHNYHYYHYYDNNNYYILLGIILQYGKTAIHRAGQRSQFAKISILFNIRESDAKGPVEFLNWIKKFNNKISLIAEKYGCEVISWQDFKDNNK